MKPPVGIAFDIIQDWEASLSVPLNQDQHQRTNDLQTWIAGAIVSAVAAERERCAKVAGGIWHLQDVDGVDITHVITDPIAAAILALK